MPDHKPLLWQYLRGQFVIHLIHQEYQPDADVFSTADFRLGYHEHPNPCTRNLCCDTALASSVIVTVAGAALIMLQHAVAEVVVEVAVDAMDVIGAVLSVVVLDQEHCVEKGDWTFPALRFSWES